MIMQQDILAPAPAVLPEALADVSLRQLLSFQAVAEQGSFHGAAEALEYTQSAVSQHVASLEAALGVRLFDRGRGRRTVTITEAGTLLLRHVTAISGRLQAARADLLAYVAGEYGTLRIGVYSSVGSKLLPAIVQRFGERWPGIAVELSEAPDQGLLDLVELGRTIAAQRLIGFRSSGSTEAIERLMRSRGHEPQFVFRSEDNATVQAMAGAGLGVALMPVLAVAPGDPSIVVIPTDLPPRRVALIWHRERYRPPAARAFVEIARHVCAEHAAELGLPVQP
jgi:DNA-binding transcriptional LysR family regulator